MQRECFAPANHPDGSHDNFETNPFGSSSGIWIGYLDEPTKRYRNFISLQNLVEKVQTNFANGYKDRFPLYLTSLEGRSGRIVPDDEEFKFNARCSACTGKANCDRVLLQYFPIDVWDYTRGRDTSLFLCAMVFKIKGQTMLSLLRHRSHGKFGFQHTTGEVSKTMAVQFASVDLTTEDEEDEPTIKSEHPDSIQDEMATATPTTTQHKATQQQESRHRQHPEEDIIDPQATPDVSADLVQELGSMMASMVADFGIDALGRPEARHLKARMGEAAKSGNRELLCRYFGSLNAVLLACD